ncbi:MAG TPA: hypothetical protein ENN85_09740 [Methanoculleus sp.]|nr:hypothetical protein [Methanoculleus sp.]
MASEGIRGEVFHPSASITEADLWGGEHRLEILHHVRSPGMFVDEIDPLPAGVPAERGLAGGAGGGDDLRTRSFRSPRRRA